MIKLKDSSQLVNDKFYLVVLEDNPALTYCQYHQKEDTDSSWRLDGFFTHRWGYGYNDYIGDWSDTLAVYEA